MALAYSKTYNKNHKAAGTSEWRKSLKMSLIQMACVCIVFVWVCDTLTG